MKASKSAELVLRASTYEKQHITPIIVKPTTDTREKKQGVYSRSGLYMPASYVIDVDDTNRAKIIADLAIVKNEPIFIDECQFFSPEVVNIFASVASNDKAKAHNNVYFYGLLKTYDNKLFEGSKAIIEAVDTIKEIKTSCEYEGCDRKATCNYINKEDRQADDVVIGDDIYHVYCKRHYNLMNK